jgi:hypothetical protein
MLKVPWSLLFPSPVPPRKKSTTYPKTSPHEIYHHQCTYPGIDPIGKTPSINPVNRTTAKDSYTEPASDHMLTPSRTRFRVLLSLDGATTVVRSNQNVTYVIRESRPEPPRARMNDQILQNKQEQVFPHQTQPGRVSVQ